MNKLLFLAVCLLVSSCASIEKDIIATQGTVKHKRLKISAELNDRLSSEYFGMLEFSFENQTSEWIRISSVSVDINNKMLSKASRFTSGAELAVWAKAIKKRNQIDDYNKAVAYSAIIGISSVTAASSSSNKTKGVATGVAATGLTSLTIEQFSNQKNKAENSNIYPSGHLLSDKLLVPPRLFSDYWLLINTPDHETNNLLRKISITVNYEDGKSEKFYLNLFPSYSDLGWHPWQMEVQSRLRNLHKFKKQNQTKSGS